MSEVVECLFSKCDALSSNPSIKKGKGKEKCEGDQGGMGTSTCEVDSGLTWR
jgi:hypothetical protein